MELDERINILKNANMLSQKNYCNVMRVIDLFEKKFNMHLTEENGATFITHLCVALERIDKNELANPLDRDAIEETKQEASYPKASEICEAIKELIPQIPNSEMEYLCAHICVMLLEADNQ